ncbi:MAG: oligosaccharide flippase family protein [Planctomycetota bacterium]|jgi:O-antigen/teichoic acid export membrane protein
MLKKNIAITFGGQVGRVLFATAATAFLARGLGADGRGLYALAIWMPLTISTFAQFGQVGVNSTFAGLYKDRREELFLQTFFFAIFFGSLGLVAMFAYFFWLPIPLGKFANIPDNIIIISALIVPIMSLDYMLRELARGAERIGSTVLITTAGFAVRAVAVFVLIFVLGMGVTTAIWIYILVQVLTSLGYIWSIRDFATFNVKKLSFAFMKKCLRFGLVFTFGDAGAYLNGCIAIFLLAQLQVSEAQIGLFAVATMLGNQMTMIPASITQAFLPHLSNNPEQRLAQTPEVFRFTLVACLFIMVGFFIFSYPVVLILLGREYLGSVPSLMVMVPGLAVYGAMRVLGVHLWVLKKPHYGTVINWIVLTVMIGLCCTLVPLMGIIGAAIAFSLNRFMVAGLVMWAYRHESKTHFGELVPRKEDFARIYHEAARVLKATHWKVV